jgi:hypothetical protein
MKYDYANATGNGAMLRELLDGYDSSGDYWRVIQDANGSVSKVLYDGDRKHATIVDADGNERVVDLDASGLVAQLVAAVGGGIEWEEMNTIMQESGLNYNTESKLWFAEKPEGVYTAPAQTAPQTTEAAAKPGFLDDVNAATQGAWNAVKEWGSGVVDWAKGLFGKKEVPEVVENDLEQNKSPEPPNPLNNQKLTQELVQDELGLPKYSACAVTTDGWINNQFLATLGKALNNVGLLSALRNAKGTAFDDEAYVSSLNGIGEALAQLAKTDNYLEFAGYYNSKEALEKAGVKYYLEKRTKIADTSKTHFIGWANGANLDPDTITIDKWWTNDKRSTATYYAFKPKVAR